MKLINVDISECQSGDILAQEITAEKGTLIIPVNTVITQKIIDVLMNFNIKRINILRPERIEEQQEQASDALYDNGEFQVFQANYKKSIGYFGEVLTEVASGKEVDGQEIHSVATILYDELKNNSDIIKYMYQMRGCSDELHTHSINVAIYAMMLAQWLGCTEYHIRNIIAAGLLHDIGKVAIPKQILNKNAPLTEDEMKIYEKHPLYGYRMSKRISGINEETRHVILKHHACSDGNGYVEGGQASRMNYYTKIVAIADTYDLLLSDYSCNQMGVPYDVFEKIHLLYLNQFDIKYVSTFLSRISICYNGAKVRISTGEIGEIVMTLPHSITKPIIKVNDRYIDTFAQDDIKIIEMVRQAS